MAFRKGFRQLARDTDKGPTTGLTGDLARRPPVRGARNQKEIGQRPDYGDAATRQALPHHRLFLAV